ncbi:17514_t:CDS:1, partial [Dentiscutata erythropus]
PEKFMISDNTIITSMESLLFLSLLDVEDNSIELPLLFWLFNTKNSSSNMDISFQNICEIEGDLNIYEITALVQEDLFKDNKDPELPYFNMLPKNDIDQLVVYETLQITNIRELLFPNELSESINKSD